MTDENGLEIRDVVCSQCRRPYRARFVDGVKGSRCPWGDCSSHYLNRAPPPATYRARKKESGLVGS